VEPKVRKYILVDERFKLDMQFNLKTTLNISMRMSFITKNRKLFKAFFEKLLQS
jgi:hypothetical protein